MRANTKKAREHLMKALKALRDQTETPHYAIGAAKTSVEFALWELGDRSVNPWTVLGPTEPMAEWNRRVDQAGDK